MSDGQLLAGQWRLDRIELVNWGTFHGHHVIEVPRKGFLLTGHSGSGKSSVVDAITAVLTPRMRASFNAAAADGSSGGADRTVLTYVRGAYSRGSDADSGEITTQYLRPPRDAAGKEKGGTWSGILLRYGNGAGKQTHLVKLFHAKRGASVPADVSELHIIAEAPVTLMDLQPYARDGLKERELKKDYPAAYVHKQHKRFTARFTRDLGIVGERATLLLHRTQAAKNLGSLDDLFRDFMLDEPETFTLADRAVEQFSELSEAHEAVVRARRQIEHLEPLEQVSTTYDEAMAAERRAVALAEALEDFTRGWKLQLLQDAQAKTVLAVDDAQAQVEAAAAEQKAADSQQRQALAAVEQRGGVRLESLEETIRTRGEAVEAAQSQLALLKERLSAAEMPVPASAAELAELKRTAERELAVTGEAESSQREAAQEVMGRKAEAQKTLAEIDRELEAMKRSRSNVGERLMAARTLIAQAAGVPEKSLPFAAELLKVRDEYAEWTGAIERVLRPLATVMLVPAAHEFAVSAAVEAHHLGARLRFETIPAESPAPVKPESAESLVYRVEVGEAPSSVQSWLRYELARRFDYRCVENPQQLAETDRGVTRAGQVKRGPRSFEKDDTSRVDDRRTWVLGFTNDAKVEHYLQLRRAAEAEIAQLDEELGTLVRADQAQRRRLTALEEVLRVEWSAVDVTTRKKALSAAESDRATLLAGDGDLRKAQAQAAEAEQALQKAQEHWQQASQTLAAATSELQRLQAAVAELDGEQIGQVPEGTAEALRAEFAEHRTQRTVTHHSIETDARRVANALNARIRAAAEEQSAAAQRITEITVNFRNDWPAAAGDLGEGVEARGGYLELLGTLRADRLPDFEARFLQMLKEQSQQNIGLLAERIRSAPREIRRRVDPINESLLRSQFAPGRYLQIQVQEARPAMVKQFLADLNTITSGALAMEESADEAEQRFEVLRKVMHALGSSEAADRTWRSHCLDTRRHVKFLGLEQDSHGEVLDYYDSGRGRSGGQKQKLVVFCLAAALRYQLTRETEDLPSYGSIVMDEAFDKADARFTRMALDIFAEFGFHMILATPLKMLQVLENYVGGIALVTSPDGQHSYASPVAFDDQRLAAGRAENDDAGSSDAGEPGSNGAGTAERTADDTLFGAEP
ncbi:ATP-binding protein [Nesterenkonia alkaliphila]|uniref:AAA family ATPase n=1 Tax=Nesterenkonia alkaliphila TaxID=1463631 RepID=A0A7K1UMJ1_9MICC|nr:ATP-binding protein [Nesterenkonia alkaliphila]MVT27699.1 AAA family ATPase [Nesterenkonia alkaliphila]GFZ87813.1 DNA repair ATPase [Nesterenkonia alkaliphila]